MGQRLLFRQKQRRVLPFQLSCENEPETRRGEQRYIPFKSERDVNRTIVRCSYVRNFCTKPQV